MPTLSRKAYERQMREALVAPEVTPIKPVSVVVFRDEVHVEMGKSYERYPSLKRAIPYAIKARRAGGMGPMTIITVEGS